LFGTGQYFIFVTCYETTRIRHKYTSDLMYISKDNATVILAKFDGNMYVMDMEIERPSKSYSA